MRTIRTRTVACAVAMAAVLSLAPLCAQTTQTALSTEAGTLSDKFALAAARDFTRKCEIGQRSFEGKDNLKRYFLRRFRKNTGIASPAARTSPQIHALPMGELQGIPPWDSEPSGLHGASEPANK